MWPAHPAALVVAVPFDHGALVASSYRVAKTPWGLVAGSGVAPGFERALDGSTYAYSSGPAGVHDELCRLWREQLRPSVREKASSARPSWVFTYEDVEVPGPIGLYRDLGDGAAPTKWGWVLILRYLDPASEDVQAVLRAGELRLQWDLDLGAGLEVRLQALTKAFAWFASEWEWVGADIEVGIHEGGHRYSVDRVGLGGTEM